MIRTAQSTDIPAIVALWQEGFGDSAEYIRLFLENRMEFDNTLLYFEDGQLACQVFILPCELAVNGRAHRAAYLYAMTTRKIFRGRGISTCLLEEAHRLLAKRGYEAAVLVPGEPSLAAFYAKRGYKPQGYIRLLQLSCTNLPACPPLSLFPIEADELFCLREKWFGGAYLRWDIPALEYILRETRFQGGDFYRFCCQGKECFASCVPSGDTLLLKEIACPPQAVAPLLTALGQLYKKQRFGLRLSDSFPDGQRVPAAMCRWLTDCPQTTPFYLSHFLD